MWAAACGDAEPDVTGPTPVRNRPPQAVGTIPEQTPSVGETATVELSSYFSDPDGDALSYTAASSNAAVAGVSVSVSSVVVTAFAQGGVTVTVTARDPQGLVAQQRFQVTVPNRAPEAVDAIPARTLSVGETGTVDISSYFSDPDGDTLSHTAVSSNAGVASASVSGVIPEQTLSVGETAMVDVSSYFTDPDGDALSYTAASSNAGVAGASVSGNSVTVTALARGVATITVTARDPGGLSASSPFAVTVEIAEGRFQIELVFATSMTRTREAAFRRAAARWMRILAPTELPDSREPRTWTCGDDPRFERYVETIDDVMILAAVDEIDGPGGTLAQAGACWRRVGTLMPLYGRMEFDVADLQRLERRGTLEDVVLHEMGHVLGIGTIWSRLGLLRDPASETEAPDTHFTGPLAIEAFDEAGGTGYRGAKVPVENRGGPGSRNAHWRETVLRTELMTPSVRVGGSSPLSAITIQSLADLGYSVDTTAADPYRLPDADAARDIDPGRLIPYGDDIWRGPVVVVDRDGRIVRVIPGSNSGDRRRF